MMLPTMETKLRLTAQLQSDSLRSFLIQDLLMMTGKTLRGKRGVEDQDPVLQDEVTGGVEDTIIIEIINQEDSDQDPGHEHDHCLQDTTGKYCSLIG